ncbi:efflux transporter, outer membrane factor (OMF) lipoprotein, NodT family [Methylobacillus rhizosphaerae]|uniref:Efflux transporter, outer membrane factor (OMF) lipoprotein, NodT family n=2 Tax=Methylobacillus rhizosphaerae TaxID=551994 RepID=A0A238ZAT2_9PROT|nr:efflux transporter, outer membrane factor (OMF) lipoprotein, NodT family [Methylobacillus rhizosphaerae]
MLSGCISMDGIDPKSTTTSVDELATGQAITQARHDLPWPQQEWWQVFQDIQLNELVAHSLQQHPDIRAARARITMAEAQAQMVGALRAPQASINSTLVRERFTSLQFIPSPWGGHLEWNNKATTNLSYDLDLWGQREQQWKSTLSQVQVATAEAQQVKLSMSSAMVMQYIALSREYALHEIAKERLEIAQHRLDILQRALAAGLGTEIEVNQAATLIPVLRAQLEASAEHVTLMQQQLAALAGEGPGFTEHLHHPALSLNAVIGLPDSLPANLIGRRPDIVAAKWRIEASSAGIASAKAAFYPNINLMSFIGFQAIGFNKLISDSGLAAGAGPAISLPLFDGGQRRGNLAARTAAYDLAVEQYNSIMLHALQDISSQLVALESDTIQHAELLEALHIAERTHKLAQTRNHAGLANYVQVLDAESQVLDQRAVLIDLEASRLSTYASLMQALGGGLEPAPAETH